MPGLRDALSTLSGRDGTYLAQAPEGWSQGRTLYGGMTAAFCAQAAARAHPGLPPLRSAQFAFIGPAAGTLRFSPSLLRQGRSAAVVAVDCHAGDELVARALLAHGVDRESEVVHDLAPIPEVPPPALCAPFRPEGPPAPGFFQQFETRLAAGARPFSRAGAPGFCAWVRHREPAGVDRTIALLALADSLPPAALVAFPKMAPISTLTWSIDVRQPIPAGEWFLLRSASEHSADGYSQQAMDLWSSDGLRVATGRQVVAIFA